MRRKKREAFEREQETRRLELAAAKQREKERTALRRRGYLTAEGHWPWKVPADLVDLYRTRYGDLGADHLGEVVKINPDRKVDNGQPKAPARKPRARTTKKAATRTTKAAT